MDLYLEDAAGGTGEEGEDGGGDLDILPTGCWDCLHPSCPHSLRTVGVLSCPDEECYGTVCLDKTSAGKKQWKLNCNRCNFQIQLFKKDQCVSITVSQDECEECDSRLLDVKFNPEKTPLEDKATHRCACIVCDDVFNTLVMETTKDTRTAGFMNTRKKGKGRKGKGKRKGGGKGKGKGRK